MRKVLTALAALGGILGVVAGMHLGASSRTVGVGAHGACPQSSSISSKWKTDLTIRAQSVELDPRLEVTLEHPDPAVPDWDSVDLAEGGYNFAECFTDAQATLLSVSWDAQKLTATFALNSSVSTGALDDREPHTVAIASTLAFGQSLLRIAPCVANRRDAEQPLSCHKTAHREVEVNLPALKEDLREDRLLRPFPSAIESANGLDAYKWFAVEPDKSVSVAFDARPDTVAASYASATRTVEYDIGSLGTAWFNMNFLSYAVSSIVAVIIAAGILRHFQVLVWPSRRHPRHFIDPGDPRLRRARHIAHLSRTNWPGLIGFTFGAVVLGLQSISTNNYFPWSTADAVLAMVGWLIILISMIPYPLAKRATVWCLSVLTSAVLVVVIVVSFELLTSAPASSPPQTSMTALGVGLWLLLVTAVTVVARQAMRIFELRNSGLGSSDHQYLNTIRCIGFLALSYSVTFPLGSFIANYRSDESRKPQFYTWQTGLINEVSNASSNAAFSLLDVIPLLIVSFVVAALLKYLVRRPDGVVGTAGMLSLMLTFAVPWSEFLGVPFVVNAPIWALQLLILWRIIKRLTNLPRAPIVAGERPRLLAVPDASQGGN